MRKVIASEFMSLDGIMDDPGGTEGKPYGGWSLKHFNEEYRQFKAAELESCDALLLGSVTYQRFAETWPLRDGDFADAMNSIKKYVVSSSLQDAEWNNAQIISENVVEAVRAIKQQPGENILVAGSNTLLTTLLEEGLVDELRIMLHPVIVGQGRRLFSEGVSGYELKLVKSQSFATGTIVLTYEPAEKAASDNKK
jgi:dihydrofolate reductase